MSIPGFIRRGGYSFRPLLKKADIRYLLALRDALIELQIDRTELTKSRKVKRTVLSLGAWTRNGKGEWRDPAGRSIKPRTETVYVWRKGVTWEITVPASKGVVLTQTFFLPWKDVEKKGAVELRTKSG